MKIKVTTHELNGSPFVIQTPGIKGKWDDVDFFVNDPSCQECDHWIVMHEIPIKETCLCPPQNIWFFMEEPRDIYIYKQNFLNQFSNIVTSQNISGNFRVFHEQQSLRWFYGWDAEQKSFCETFDSLELQSFPQKDRLLSVISSNKQFCQGHKNRLIFTEEAKVKLNADAFGWGLNNFSCKRETILPYKYHIVIENSTIDDYWTEKLADCYLGWAFPIYCGCTNLEKYFNKNSFFKIDITNKDKAIEDIKNFIQTHDYEASKFYIEEARKDILNKYNFFPNASRLCRENNFYSKKTKITLTPEIQTNPIKMALKEHLPRSYKYFSTNLEKIKKLNKFKKKYRNPKQEEKNLSFWENNN